MPVFTYKHEAKPVSKLPFFVSPKKKENQMNPLNENGYTVKNVSVTAIDVECWKYTTAWENTDCNPKEVGIPAVGQTRNGAIKV